ncbi:ATP-grasp domain-containing protein [Streptomyces sp. NPDC001851]|uniref:ATP-grasp domain-containing protein n=1 Tax=Streptomyces sp. NPDC001851 TaxID=3154529 RepID=UPI003333525B
MFRAASAGRCPSRRTPTPSASPPRASATPSWPSRCGTPPAWASGSSRTRPLSTVTWPRARRRTLSLRSASADGSARSTSSAPTATTPSCRSSGPAPREALPPSRSKTCGHAAPGRDEDFRPTAQRLVDLCTALGVEGSVNVDMILIHADGVYHVLEINPRIGGATTLSIAASGLNTFAALLDILTGAWPARAAAPAERFPIECLTANPTPALLADLRARIDLVTCHDLIIDGHNHGGILTFTVNPGDEQRVVKELGTLCARTGFIPEPMLDKIRRLLDPGREGAGR